MTLMEFERQMIKQDIKFHKKIAKTYFFSIMISIAVIGFNLFILMQSPDKWMNAMCIGCMFYNIIWCFMEWKTNLSDMKDYHRRETLYQEYELQKQSNSPHSEHLLDTMSYMSGIKSSSGLPK